MVEGTMSAFFVETGNMAYDKSHTNMDKRSGDGRKNCATL